MRGVRESVTGKKTPLLLELYYIGVAIILMFYYFFNSGSRNIFLVSVFSLLVIYSMLTKTNRLQITPSDIAWLVYILFAFVGGITLGNFFDALKGIGVLFICWGTRVISQSLPDMEYSFLLKLLTWIGMIHVVAVLLQMVYPAFIFAIDKTILSPEQYALITNCGPVYRAGITGQPGTAGYCTALAFALCFNKALLSGKRRKMWIVLAVVCATALLLTGKRTLFLVAISISIVSAGIVLNRIYQKRNRFFGVLLLFLIIGAAAYFLFPSLQGNVQRLTSMDLAGREERYKIMIQQFITHPLLGVGYRNEVNDFTAHNEYLSVLSANGIIGFLPWLFAIFQPLFYGASFFFRNSKRLQGLLIQCREELFQLSLSLFWQLEVLAYALTGNPLSDKGQLFCYFIFTTIGQRAIKKLNNILCEMPTEKPQIQ